ncbi:glutamyl-tRNA(Gln) amidotransferase subunit A [Priestia megaterium]|uniref:amidase n=1 Tax=Priestia megaterium TaxID=1404 RepID=UPI000E15B4A0|nr:amidase [Priestia megaterium]SUV10161.1 glutamyl-tRNA(Gln) amidotransferase subunit A [Priestia megaterium]
MNIDEVSPLIEQKKLSPTELVKHTLEKISNENSNTNSFITVCSEKALKAAEELEKELVEGKVRSKLHGVPITLKDLIFTKGIRTTMGSKLYKDFIPDTNATIVEKLENAGAIIIGKVNTHEFAYGPTGDRSYFGSCLNPYDSSKITGGSSSGSAASVGAGLVNLSVGTDTGGSIRIPSSACGTVGMKPTFGLVSKKDVHALSYTQDHVGPITRTVKENALLLNVLAGYDPNDPYSLNMEIQDYSSLIGTDVKGMVIGIPSFYLQSLEEEVHQMFSKCIKVCEYLGAKVTEVKIDDIEEISHAQSITIQFEASSIHAHTLRKHQKSIDSEVYERLKASQLVKAYEYVHAQSKKRELIYKYNQVFDHVDILLTPTLPIVPPNIGQREVIINGKMESVRSALLRLTAPTNFTGNPSLSLPVNLSKGGLPMGLQLISRHGMEAKIYQFAYMLEQHFNFAK